MECAVEPIAGAVASEHTACPIGTVGRWSEADDKKLGIGVPESGYGSAPVVLVAKGGALARSDQLPPLDESRAATALDEVGVQRS